MKEGLWWDVFFNQLCLVGFSGGDYVDIQLLRVFLLANWTVVLLHASSAPTMIEDDSAFSREGICSLTHDSVEFPCNWDTTIHPLPQVKAMRRQLKGNYPPSGPHL